jgi:hypothetical protein
MRFLFLTLAILMLFVWVGAFVLFHVAGALIHLFLLLAVVFFIVHLVRPRRVERP